MPNFKKLAGLPRCFLKIDLLDCAAYYARTWKYHAVSFEIQNFDTKPLLVSKIFH